MSQTTSSPTDPPAPESRGASFQHDFLASIVVFLVALPLCMGIALASGAPVSAGLITGIVGGLVVGCLAGSPLQVSGPAAGLTVIVYEVIQRHGLEMLGLVVLIAGAIQVVAGLLRWGQWFRAVSPAVIKGMLAGIGVLIFASQFHVMVDDRPKGSGLENLVTIPQAIAKGVGWPTLGSSEERDYKSNQLRAIGELHRQQVRLQERVTEQLPDHADPEAWRAEPESQHEAEGEALQKLAGNQQAIVAELKELEARTQKLADTQDIGSARLEQIENATQDALKATEAAAEKLAGGEIYVAMKSQKAAVDSLEHLMAQFKSHQLAAGVGLLTILLIIGWQVLIPKKLKFIPAPLVAIVVATGVATVLALPVLYVEVPTNLLSDITLPHAGILTDAPWLALLSSGLVIAVIASAETLLCATAVDQMHQGPRTRYDRELAAQGVGNMVCGLLGALPMTGVIVRSSANVQAGARSRLSAILHGAWLLLFVVVLASLLRLIPTASLAAMLVYTGYKLVNVAAIKQLRKFGWSEVAIYFATVITIVATDLLTGVIAGILLSGLKLLFTFSHLKTDLQLDKAKGRATLELEGAATFMRLPRLAAELERVPPNAELHVDFTHLTYIDHACLDLLANWANQHHAMGGQLVLDWDSLHARFCSEPLKNRGALAGAGVNGNGKVAVEGTPSEDRAEAEEVVTK